MCLVGSQELSDEHGVAAATVDLLPYSSKQGSNRLILMTLSSETAGSVCQAIMMRLARGRKGGRKKERKKERNACNEQGASV